MLALMLTMFGTQFKRLFFQILEHEESRDISNLLEIDKLRRIVLEYIDEKAVVVNKNNFEILFAYYYEKHCYSLSEREYCEHILLYKAHLKSYDIREIFAAALHYFVNYEEGYHMVPYLPKALFDEFYKLAAICPYYHNEKLNDFGYELSMMELKQNNITYPEKIVIFEQDDFAISIMKYHNENNFYLTCEQDEDNIILTCPNGIYPHLVGDMCEKDIDFTRYKSRYIVSKKELYKYYKKT